MKVSYLRTIFDREYTEKWTDEHFVIVDRFMRAGIAVYKLKDFANQLIGGTFYTEELQKVFIPENKTYKIDKIIRTRTRKGRKEVLVSWRGWPKQFSSWISAKEVKALKQGK